MNEFFVGYLPVPPGIARFLRKIVVILGLLAAMLPLVLLRGQGRFANAAFEFGKVRDFEGTIATRPYPALLVPRPGQSVPQESYSSYLLVAAGKHGADNMVAGFDGKQVRLRGQLIYRSGETMVEIEPGSIVLAERAVRTPLGEIRDLGTITVTGEIVDSKCYLGVMNPGSGKVHRDCAARCLSGGIPPIFITSRGGEQYLLVGPDGRAIGHNALREFIAEPITVTGKLTQQGAERMLSIDVASLRHSSGQLQAGIFRRKSKQPE